MAYIYKIINKKNGKCYIGKTESFDPYSRWTEHKAENRRARSNRALYSAMRKYGEESFTFMVLEKTEEPNKREIDYITLHDSYHSGYNETLGGDGRSYLNLDTNDVCMYYLAVNSIATTAEYYKCDVGTIRNILYNKNIPTLTGAQVTKNKTKKAVAQIDKITDMIIATFESTMEAERAVGGNKHIADVCNRKRKTADGYKWKYI